MDLNNNSSFKSPILKLPSMSTISFNKFKKSPQMVESLPSLPSFHNVPLFHRQNLFVMKLNLCSVVFDFTDPSKNLVEKEKKMQTLLELIGYVSSHKSKFNDVQMKEMTKMVSANLFRTLPSLNLDKKLSNVNDTEDEESGFDPLWPHLQIVYEFLLRFIASPNTDTKHAKRYIDHSFILKLLDLFDSEDQREREYLKTILHRIYGKFMVHRSFIRKAINNIFYTFIFETEKHNGITEFLEVLGSIINGFSSPLKEEHKAFLQKVLIPLHKPKCVSLYHQQLSYCVTQFVEKDSKLADTVILGLLKYWPITNSSKEISFISELEDILLVTQASEFQQCMIPLFHQIAHCLSSLHFQVAERALLLWNNDHIRYLITLNRKVILPIIFPALEKSTRTHWNQAVQSLTLNVSRVFSEFDQPLFDECMFKHKENQVHEKHRRDILDLAWKRLENVAACKANANPVVGSPKSNKSRLVEDNDVSCLYR